MTNAEIEADRAIIAAASPGPWHTVDAPWGDGTWVTTGRSGDPHAGHFVADCDELFDDEENASIPVLENASFIAAARTRWPAALDEVEGLRGLLREMHRRSLSQARRGKPGAARFVDDIDDMLRRGGVEP